MRYVFLPVFIAVAMVFGGCTATVEVGEPPVRASYAAWGARMADIPQVARAVDLVDAALVHHRKANKLDNREDVVDEINMSLALLGQASDQLYIAWDLYPEYEKFILMELDKVYGFIHSCVAMRPYYFDPTDPLNIYGGALTYEQRQRMSQYRQKIEKWQKASGE